MLLKSDGHKIGDYNKWWGRTPSVNDQWVKALFK